MIMFSSLAVSHSGDDYSGTKRRRPQPWREEASYHGESNSIGGKQEALSTSQSVSWKRIFLLIIAITIHNIPGKRMQNT